MDEPASGERRRPGRPVAMALRVMSARLSRRCSVAASSGKRAVPFSLGMNSYSSDFPHVFLPLRYFSFLDNSLDKILRRDAISQAIEVENYAMAQSRESDVLHIFLGDVVTAFEQSTYFSRRNNGLQPAWAGSVANIFTYLFGSILLVRVGRQQQAYPVFFDMRCHRNGAGRIN